MKMETLEMGKPRNKTNLVGLEENEQQIDSLKHPKTFQYL